jgi:hypothetical protein
MNVPVHRTDTKHEANHEPLQHRSPSIPNAG